MDTTMVIWIALVVFSVFTTGRLLVGIGQSAWHLHKARTTGGTVIRCNSTVYKMWIYLFAIVTEGVLSAWLMSLALRFQRLPVLYRVLIWPAVATTAIDFIIHTVAIFREKYCYLTDEGLLHQAVPVREVPFRMGGVHRPRPPRRHAPCLSGQGEAAVHGRFP